MNESIHRIKEDFLMLTVSEKALEVIKEFIKEKRPDSSIRITMSAG